ncbi:MAG: heparan-alpha-glucosaminide N-acetyltransferase domain-containing protein [Verrucomicrobiota bacterium]
MQQQPPMPNAPASPSASPESAAAKPARLMSLDALRGFDMFWIVGADALVEALRKLSGGRVVQGLAGQLEHVGWAGFHFEDLIFPMFVFITGVSLVFSLTRTIEQQGRMGAVVRIARRAVLMYLLGIFYYGGFSTPFHEIRLLGVLQRIALAYLFAGLIFCFFQRRGRIIWCVGLLVGYWAVMTFVPVPGGAAGNFAEGQNLANWVDKQYLPLRKWDGDHDPEGLLSTLPAIANCLLGVFAGVWLRNAKRSDWTKVGYLAAAGVALVALGWLWNFQFPVIKKIWTSSFVLVACGYSCLLLAAFHLVIENWGWRGWAQPFVWIGMNPITIYMIHNLVDVGQIAQRFVGGDLSKFCLSRYGELAVALAGMAITFGICRFLYQRKIFLRL